MRCDGQPTSEMKSYVKFGDGQSSCFQKHPVFSIKDNFYSYMCALACLCGSSQSVLHTSIHMTLVACTCKNPQPEWQDGEVWPLNNDMCCVHWLCRNVYLNE